MTESNHPGEHAPLFLEIRGLRKSFGGVQALKGVDLTVRAGEIHGLVGANGAGKSTLIRTLAGITQPDGGEILLDGLPVVLRDAQHAMSLGLSFIHQELNLIPKFTALQNLTLGLKKQKKVGMIDWKAMKKEVLPVVDQLGIRFPLEELAENLSVADQWLLSIGRALIRKARFIAMDEPTASLSPQEVDHLFKVIREVTDDGMAIVYVSHRLHEVEVLCDRVTVFKDGERVAFFHKNEISRTNLVQAIVGKNAHRSFARRERLVSAPTILEAKDLSQGQKVKKVSFSLKEGEILGLGGLAGAGRTETARLLFGVDQADSGQMFFKGVPLKIKDPHAAVRLGIGFVPEERRSQGLMLAKSVTFNVNITNLKGLRFFRWLSLISSRRAIKIAEGLVKRLSLKTPTTETRVNNLSGGNQQKVVIGKWLHRKPLVLIMDEPTRGVDIGARSEIYEIVRNLADSGTSVLFISSDVEELVLVSDRVLVMVEGRISGELSGEALTEEAVLRLSYTHINERSGK